MNFEENVGKEVINEETGEIRVINSVGTGTHIILTKKGDRKNWIGFLKGSLVDPEWKLLEHKKHIVSFDKGDGYDTTVYSHMEENKMIIDNILSIKQVKKETLSDKIYINSFLKNPTTPSIIQQEGSEIPNPKDGFIFTKDVKESLNEVKKEANITLGDDRLTIIWSKFKEIFGSDLI